MVAKTNQPRILLVDDSTTNIALLEAVLEDKGYQIIKAQNVQDAFLSIRRKTPDLILLDLLIPKTSGFDFFEQLRKDEKTSNIPVIVISALSDKEIESKAMELGAVDFINKPVDIQYLVKRVESVL
ncbi:MAG: response regulator [Bacteroidales bacterium]|nr:response regulator [Bacteroidales bacterium]